jgi:hypothetical protein
LGERRKLPQWGLGRSPSRQRFFEFILPIQAFSDGLWDQCMDSDDSKSLMFYYILRFNACIVNQNIFLLEKCHCVQNVDPTYLTFKQ